MGLRFDCDAARMNQTEHRPTLIAPCLTCLKSQPEAATTPGLTSFFSFAVVAGSKRLMCVSLEREDVDDAFSLLKSAGPGL